MSKNKIILTIPTRIIPSLMGGMSSTFSEEDKTQFGLFLSEYSDYQLANPIPQGGVFWAHTNDFDEVSSHCVMVQFQLSPEFKAKPEFDFPSVRNRLMERFYAVKHKRDKLKFELEVNEQDHLKQDFENYEGVLKGLMLACDELKEMEEDG